MGINNDKAMPALARVQNAGIGVGVVGLVALWYAIATSQPGAWQSYLLGFALWLGITLGCLGLMILQNITRGSWGVALVRFWDGGASNLILLAILIVPLLVEGYRHIYPWGDPNIVATNKIVAGKAAVYFDHAFFVGRAALYFAVWIFGCFWLAKRSREEDATGDPTLADKRRSFAAPWAVLFVLTVNFAITDWVMSLEAEWFSTILGLLFVVGTSLSAMALGTFYLVLARNTQPYAGKLFGNQWKDLGNLLFTLTVLWAYMSFSQFLVTYSGNLPEVIPYYLKRNIGGWEYVGGALIFLHFLFPFFLLLSSRTKRTPAMLGGVALFIVLIRFVDIIWNVVPSLHREGASFVWSDAAAFLGIGGIWIAVLMWRLRTTGLYPNYVELPKPAEAAARV